MLIQSGGGKVYAVLANSESYELGVLPNLILQSTTVFLQLRLRFKSIGEGSVFNPRLAPKKVLVGGIERSIDTLRGTVLLNTGFTLDKLGSGFPDVVTKKLLDNAGWLLPQDAMEETVALYLKDLRDDFAKDFALLVAPTIEPFYPPKDFSEAAVLQTAFDLQIFASQTAGVAPPSPFTAMDGGKLDMGPDVQKIVPGDDELVLPAPPEPEPETNVKAFPLPVKAGLGDEADDTGHPVNEGVDGTATDADAKGAQAETDPVH